MSVEKIDVHYVAKLARIELTEAEEAGFATQLEDIVSHVQQLNQADISSISLSGTIEGDDNNRLREDTPHPSLPTEKVLANAPSSADGEIVMPKIID